MFIKRSKWLGASGWVLLMAFRELFESARAGDICVVNADDARVAGLPIPEGVRTLEFGTKACSRLRSFRRVYKTIA